ncbi:MAG: hypothetical protein ACYC1D_09140 [Acidimicrobiales bacterium]
MTQPDYVPLAATDRVRPSDRLTVPGPWRQDRPGDLVGLEPPRGPCFGSTGPDLGYGLKLAKRFEDRLQLTEGESRDDAVAGAFACGARRSAFFHRAPVIHDMEWAYTLWGFLGDAPADLVSWRQSRFRGAAHDYWDQRQIVDLVREATLRLTPAEVRAQVGQWRQLVFAD